MVSMLSLAAPKPEANAGFLVVAGLEQHVWNHKHKFDDYIIYLVGASLAFYSYSVLATGLYSKYSIGAAIVLLDEKIENNASNIKASLQNRYPFVDDMSVINDLSQLIIQQYPHVKDAKGTANIKLVPSDVKSVIQRLDLNEAQSEELIQSLSS